MNINFIYLIFISALFTACGGQRNDLEPSKDKSLPIAPISDISYESHMKYGEEKTTTANGWNVSIDTTDPVKNITTGNGWTAEVKHK